MSRYKISLTQLEKLITYGFRADVPIHLRGAPGIGKTQCVNAYAKRVGVALYSLELAQCDPADLGGIPVPTDGAIVRLPIGPIRHASDKPAILFLDEWSQASPALQGAALTLVNERRAGDFRLHPDTRIVLASNPTDQGANAQELAPPAINRVITVDVQPTLDEVQAYLQQLGPRDSTLRDLGVDFAATLELVPALLQLEPPQGRPGQTWASPRAIEKALRFYATALDAGEPEGSPILVAAHIGALGEESALQHLEYRQLRDAIASRKEILVDPEHARIPADPKTAIAALGVIVQAALKDPAAAWIYADRMPAEVRAACGKMLLAYPIMGSTPRDSDARKIMVRINAQTGVRLSMAHAQGA